MSLVKNGPSDGRCSMGILSPLHPNFEKKIVWGHHELSRVFSWDHFKPYLSIFGPLVWVLEGCLCPPLTEALFLTDYQKLRTYTPFLKKKIRGNHILSRVLFWDHFNSKFICLGLLVYILLDLLVGKPAFLLTNTIFEWSFVKPFLQFWWVKFYLQVNLWAF